MRVVVTVAPTVEPISTDEAKLALHIDHTEENARIEALVKSARTFFEEESGYALVNRTLKAYLRFWPKATNILLPYPPLSSVTDVKYNLAGVEATLSALTYTADKTSRQGSVVLLPGQAWPVGVLHPPGVTVTYVAGFGALATDVPADVREALYLMVGYWYEYPEAVFIPRRGGADPEIMPLSAWDVIQRYRDRRER